MRQQRKSPFQLQVQLEPWQEPPQELELQLGLVPVQQLVLVRAQEQPLASKRHHRCRLQLQASSWHRASSAGWCRSSRSGHWG